MTERIKQLTVGRLLGGDAHYRIPIYQRNYAWDEGEITQLIQDVIDYTKRDQNYYIGTLVVFKVVKERADKEVYETIDGQQRLTTLSLLASYLKNEKEKEETDVFWCRKLSLEFECRENSRRTLSKIFGGNTESLAPDETNSALLNGYQIIRKILPQRLSEHNVSEKDFAGYLFERVHIMRVTLPQDTEDYLNHYFEIMNNRGEQLEKHEVLKSRLLEILNRIPDPEEKAENKECMHRIWEACSNMEKYAQSGFSPKERHNLFGNNDWGELKAKDFNAVKNSLSYGDPKEARTDKLTEIISHPQPPNARTSDDPNAADVDQERFNSVTNFPNFLLHVLLVSTGKDLPLDDKRLIDIFEDEIIKKDSPDEVKKFGFDLLKCKYIYDRFIIKREFSQGKDRWRLQRYKRSDGGQKAYYTNTFGEGDGQDDINRRILMLLAAFHVSTPTQVYKHWLNAALHWLYNAESITAESYCTHLENVAKAFVFDRYLGGHPNAEYYEIIYGRNGLCKSTSSSLPDDKLRERLSFGNIKNNLVFNYLDYILWLKHKDSDQIGKIISTYEFTFRSSVEHYYPQHPLPGHPPLQQETLNSFGNLCLISHGKNSRLSNFMPQAKKEYYQKNPIDSVKQYLMMQEASWDASSIQNHYDEMVKVLREQLIVAPDF